MTFRCSITCIHFVCQVLWYPFDLVFLYMYDKDNKVTIKKLCRFNIDNTLSSLFIYDPIIRHVRINMILYLLSGIFKQYKAGMEGIFMWLRVFQDQEVIFETYFAQALQVRQDDNFQNKIPPSKTVLILLWLSLI